MAPLSDAAGGLLSSAQIGYLASALSLRLLARQSAGPPQTSAEHIAYQFTHLTQPTRLTLYLAAGFFAFILIVWPWKYLNYIVYPFKLATIAFHEFGHASAAVLTGGKVTGISIEPNLGGLTTYRGGMQWIVLPAGYLGSAFWGSIMVFAAFDPLASKVVSLIIPLLLLFVVLLGKNWLTRLFPLFFVALFAVLWWLATTPTDPDALGLRITTLFFGIMSSMYALWDIIEDLITRRVNSSDATQFAKLCGNGCAATAPFWGGVWLFVSFGFLGAALFGGVVAFNRAPYPPV